MVEIALTKSLIEMEQQQQKRAFSDIFIPKFINI